MVDQLMQAYHWSYEEAMRRTLPQIVLLNHAATVNSKRMDARIKAKDAPKDEGDEPVWHGKKLSEMNSDEMTAYYSDF